MTQSIALPAVLAEHREAIGTAVRQCRGRRERVFGSVARGDDGPDSDIDFLVDFEPGSSLFDLLHLTRSWRTCWADPVDVVSAGVSRSGTSGSSTTPSACKR